MKLKSVSTKIAIQLKELGFNWKCNWYLERKGELYECVGNTDLYINKKEYCPYPTQALVSKWFRDEFKIFIFIDFTVIDWDKSFSFCYEIISPESLEDLDSIIYEESFNNYEDAEEAGILKAIQILKNIQNGNIKKS